MKEFTKTLIIAWSIAWGLFLVAISNLKVRGIPIFAVYEGLKIDTLLKSAILYGVGIWAIGCCVIGLLILTIERLLRIKFDFRKPRNFSRNFIIPGLKVFSRNFIFYVLIPIAAVSIIILLAFWKE
jgi:hypothetical protein